MSILFTLRVFGKAYESAMSAQKRIKGYKIKNTKLKQLDMNGEYQVISLSIAG